MFYDIRENKLLLLLLHGYISFTINKEKDTFTIYRQYTMN